MLGPEDIFCRVEAAFGLERSFILTSSRAPGLDALIARRSIERQAAYAALAVLLHEYGKSTTEIAKLTKRTPGTVGAIIRGARGLYMREGAPVPAEVRASFIRALEAP